jgi:hypothetical protein
VARRVELYPHLFSSHNTAPIMATPEPVAALPIRTFLLARPAPQVPVAMSRSGRSLGLIHMGPTDGDTDEDWSPQLWATLTVLVSADPYPGFSGEGYEMVWVSCRSLYQLSDRTICS